jgi:anti-anti-sigma factor
MEAEPVREETERLPGQQGIVRHAGDANRSWQLEVCADAENQADRNSVQKAPTIEAAFERIAETGTTVVVDFGEASFIDSTVIQALVRSMKRGENLLLVVPERSAASRVLELTGVSALLQVFETRDAALRTVPPEDQPARVAPTGA